MSNDLEQKRAFVSDLYRSPGWKARVKTMPESQVIAIYLKEKNKPPKRDKIKETTHEEFPF